MKVVVPAKRVLFFRSQLTFAVMIHFLPSSFLSLIFSLVYPTHQLTGVATSVGTIDLHLS